MCSDNKQRSDEFDRSSGAAALDARRIVRHVRELLAADEVSYWCVESEDRGLAARRVAATEPDPSGVQAPLRLSMEQCAGYFAATQATGLFISQDALRDDRISGTRASYLEPRDIQAVLSINLSVDSQLLAIISCAQRGRHRHWSASDVAVMQQLSADLTVESWRRRERRDGVGPCRFLGIHRAFRLRPFNAWKGIPC
ncbi:GAF domain-containing protein [Pelomonas sp. SE-A7]|uniref:GAF domain-containing protein n=1 Tax=Pelomonas sp. SE-A7 TaxID=3054953 RepID=UPI00259CA918|nr:GAF domain-containing protein [Pelomonas sp. SE-A7]MDM4765257.1 GAF domain-containing protein [Pelomonas sp. SE-A7]